MTIKRGFQISLIVIAIAVVFLLLQGLLFSQNKTTLATIAQDTNGTLVVNGVGEIKADPDMAIIHLGAVSTANSAEETQQNVNERVNAIKKVLKDYKIDDKDIKTAYYQVYPFEESNEANKRIEKYRAHHSLEIQFKDIELLGELIDASSEAGANQIDQIRFSLQEPEKAEHDALKQAIEKTKEKADVMATAAGKKRGEVIQISDQAAQISVPYADHEQIQAVTQDESGSSMFEPGEIEITQRVDVVYRLK